MKKQKRNTFRFIRRVISILSITLFTLIFNIIITNFWAESLSTSVWFFFGKSEKAILSDLLFLEGIITFAAGALLIGGLSETVGGLYHGGMYRGGAKLQPDERRRLRERQINSGILLISIGAMLIGLSLSIELLPL